MRLLLLAGLLGLAACSPPATQGNGSTKSFAQVKGDPVAGATAFNACRACHSLEAGKSLIGPSLHGVVGRMAGSVPGFAYSPALRGYGKAWTPEVLQTFVAGPQAAVPGTKMSYGGMPDVQMRADLIAYLDTQK